MRRLALGLVLATLAARPAGADTILYATAATTRRVLGYCLGPNGGLVPTPSVDIETRGRQPRRLLVKNGVLFVAQVDRVEAFRILPDGRLRRNPLPGDGRAVYASTERLRRMSPRDVAVNPEGTMLYVPQRRRDRIVAHPLVDGLPAASFTSCLQGPPRAGYRDLLVDGTRLYVSAAGAFPGRVEVFPLGPDGSLPLPPEGCERVPGSELLEPTPPASERRRLLGPKAMELDGDVLYVHERGRGRITAFRLHDGHFLPPVTEGRRTVWQPFASRTGRVGSYEDLVRFGSTLVGTQFFRGRIDAFRLGEPPDRLLPRRASRRSEENLRLSPVRMAVDETTGTLYVAAGIFDRVLAYSLNPDASGRLRPLRPTSQTAAQANAFPNDVALAVLDGACRR